METRKLGNNGPDITTIGFGAWAVGGGDWQYGWGPTDDNESVAAIQAAIDAGMNWIDTAAVYGFGHSEEVVARAIEGRRDDVLLFTKCGLVRQEGGDGTRRDLTPASIRAELEASLRRLRTDYVDLYQFHWPDVDTNTPVEESWATMQELVKEGKVRYPGVCNFHHDLLQRCLRVGPVTSLQPPFSILRRMFDEDGTLDFCKENGIGVIVYSPMQSGLLTGKFDRASIDRLDAGDWRRRDSMYKEPKLSHNLALVERIRPIAERRSLTVGQLAIAWTLMHPAITAAIVGAKTAAQVAENTHAADQPLTEADMAEIAAAIAESGV